VDNLDRNLVDYDFDYLLVVAVDYNTHNLTDLVDKQVDFVVDIAHKHYSFVLLAVVVIVLADIPLLLLRNILPEKPDSIKR
jgi:hypothetical protein